VRAQPTLSLLTSMPGGSRFGQTVLFTATVSAPVGILPSGTVTFKDGTATLGTVSLDTAGVAKLATALLAVNPGHTITATYNGNASFAMSPPAATQTQFVQRASSVALTSSGASPLVGVPVTLRATVSGVGGTPTGTVTFYDGGTAITTVPLDPSGVALFI